MSGLIAKRTGIAGDPIELRLMTRMSSMGIAVTDQPPPEAVQAWDLVVITDSAPVHGRLAKQAPGIGTSTCPWQTLVYLSGPSA